LHFTGSIFLNSHHKSYFIELNRIRTFRKAIQSNPNRIYHFNHKIRGLFSLKAIENVLHINIDKKDEKSVEMDGIKKRKRRV